MSARAGGVRRLVEVLPVLAALALHAVAHGRWPLVGPAALALVFFAWRGTVTDNSTLRLAGAVLAGGLLGGLALWFGEPPPGPVPGTFLSILCGVLLALSVSGAIARSPYAWLYAWLLAILSLHARQTPLFFALLGLLALCTLLAAQAGSLRRDRASLAGGALFAALTAIGTLGLGRLVYASEGRLVQLIGGTIATWLDPPSLGGVGLQESITLGPRGSVERSAQALLELSGTAPVKLRGVVLDRFDGVSWSASPEGLRRLPPPQQPSPGTARAITLTPLEALGAVLPLPAGTFAVDGAAAWFLGGWVARVEGGDAAVTLRRAAGGQLLPEPAPGPGLLEVPAPLAAQLRPFALEGLPASGTARARAAALELWFQARFTYALDTNLSGSAHPLVALLRDRRPAYCVYFASAMAALLRVSGIPARVVGGFVAEEENALTGDLVVRGRDAHAWVEAWLAEEGRWETFDPTPFQSREAALERDPKTGWVLSAARAAASEARRFWRSLRRDPAGTLVRSPLAWLLVIGGGGFLALRRVRLARGQQQRGARRGGDAELERLYRRYLATLQRAGLSPLASETDDELLARLAQARGAPAAEAARAFVEEYRQARFRGVPRGALRLGEALDAVARSLGLAA